MFTRSTKGFLQTLGLRRMKEPPGLTADQLGEFFGHADPATQTRNQKAQQAQIHNEQAVHVTQTHQQRVAFQKPVVTQQAQAPTKKQAHGAMQKVAQKLQHESFKNGRPWTQSSQFSAAHQIADTLKSMPQFAMVGRERLHVEAQFVLAKMPAPFSATSEGGYFKANKKLDAGHPGRKLDTTQVRTAQGQVFELINSPTHLQQHLINQMTGMNINAGKFMLGKGAFGKVRLARNLETGEFVAVKKFSSRENAMQELKEFAIIGQGKGLATTLGHAHIQQTNKKGQHIEKSYVFLPLSNMGSGVEASQKLQSMKKTDPAGAEKELNRIAFNYTEHLATLHAKGLVHRDIKPDNYLHSSDGSIKLSDFGFVDQGDDASKYSKRYVGTPGFIPPEMTTSEYSGTKHDAFSLGVTLLEMKLGTMVDQYRGNHLTVGNRSFKLSLDESGNCWGTNLKHPDLANMKYETLDEVITGLLSRDPKLRLTPKDVINTPYMKGLAQQEKSDHIRPDYLPDAFQLYNPVVSAVLRPNYGVTAPMKTQFGQTPATIKPGLNYVAPRLQPDLPNYAPPQGDQRNAQRFNDELFLPRS